MELWPVYNAWEIRSRRKMTVIPLPPLGGLDAAKARLPPWPVAGKKSDAEAQLQWEITKHVKIDMVGGHPWRGARVGVAR